jgi:hypothetical protein
VLRHRLPGGLPRWLASVVAVLLPPLPLMAEFSAREPAWRPFCFCMRIYVYIGGHFPLKLMLTPMLLKKRSMPAFGQRLVAASTPHTLESLEILQWSGNDHVVIGL